MGSELANFVLQSLYLTRGAAFKRTLSPFHHYLSIVLTQQYWYPFPPWRIVQSNGRLFSFEDDFWSALTLPSVELPEQPAISIKSKQLNLNFKPSEPSHCSSGPVKRRSPLWPRVRFALFSDCAVPNWRFGIACVYSYTNPGLIDGCFERMAATGFERVNERVELPCTDKVMKEMNREMSREMRRGMDREPM